MKLVAGLIFLAFSTILSSACSAPPEVVQGTVVGYDEVSAVLVISDERVPGSSLEFSAEDAELGAALNTGDTVRIAYYKAGESLVATRIMNITRQTELKKSGDAH